MLRNTYFSWGSAGLQLTESWLSSRRESPWSGTEEGEDQVRISRCVTSALNNTFLLCRIFGFFSCVIKGWKMNYEKQEQGSAVSNCNKVKLKIHFLMRKKTKQNFFFNAKYFFIYMISVHFNEDDDATVTSCLNKTCNRGINGLKKYRKKTQQEIEQNKHK